MYVIVDVIVNVITVASVSIRALYALHSRRHPVCRHGSVIQRFLMYSHIPFPFFREELHVPPVALTLGHTSHLFRWERALGYCPLPDEDSTLSSCCSSV